MHRLYKKIILVVLSVVLMGFLNAMNVHAANTGDKVNFNVDPAYDITARPQVAATLIKSTSSLYFYIETNWWDGQTLAKQNEILTSLDNLSTEFTNRIHPILTSLYGSEWNPGIDGDNKISILFESMNNNLGGYFRSQDEYSKLQDPSSNEREMVYMPVDKIGNSQLKVFLAHEFVHLIVFNQKEKLQDVQEEVWLSEARSDYASTILGYDEVYDGSNLQRRVQDFLSQPNDSLTEWQGTKYDYAVESLFMHYLVDRYGLTILTDSLKSKLVGINSINEALAKSGVKEDFSQIFTNWTVTMIINDCGFSQPYCYVNKNLTGLKINPTLIFLPLTGNSSLSMNNVTKNWSANWQKIIGGNGDLTLKFSSFTGLNFQMPYILYDKNNNYTISFLKLDANQKGTITIKNFGSNYNSLVVIPSLQSKLSGFDGLELSYPYTFTISITKSTSDDNIAPPPVGNSCSQLNNNLQFGMSGSDVVCLQQFLKMQGSGIYPEGLTTGFFGNLTKIAAIRFQKKYQIFPTGFVGILTRAKINTLLK